jgi:hypothetical protein
VTKYESLGFSSYCDYLNSGHWAAFKAKYRASKLPKVCAICRRPGIQLHHHDYSRLGKESLDDVTPLCHLHHERVHDVLNKARKSVSETRWAIEIIKKDIQDRRPHVPGPRERQALIAARRELCRSIPRGLKSVPAHRQNDTATDEELAMRKIAAGFR